MKRYLALVSLVFILSGCPKGTPYHDAVVAEHQFKTIVQSFQQAEVIEFQNGRISPAEHAQLEAGVAKVAQAGIVLTTAMQQGALNSDVNTDISALSAALTSLLNDGVLGVKNPQSVAALSAIVKTAQAIVQNVLLIVQGNSVPANAGSVK